VKEPETTHGSFVVERGFAQPPEEVFRYFADADRKRRWFVGDARDETSSYALGFRVGGTENTRWTWRGGGPIPVGTITGNDAVVLDIVPHRRIVVAYSMQMGSDRFSSSLLTFEFLAEGTGTRLRATEQGAFFERSDGPEMRENGWRGLLESLANAIDAEARTSP